MKRHPSKLQKIEAIANDPRGEANTRAIAARTAAAMRARARGKRQLLTALDTYQRNVSAMLDGDTTAQSLELAQLIKDVVDMKRRVLRKKRKPGGTPSMVYGLGDLYAAINRLEDFYKVQ